MKGYLSGLSQKVIGGLIVAAVVASGVIASIVAGASHAVTVRAWMLAALGVALVILGVLVGWLFIRVRRVEHSGPSAPAPRKHEALIRRAESLATQLEQFEAGTAGTFLAPAEDGIIDRYNQLLNDAREAEPSNATLETLKTGEVQATARNPYGEVQASSTTYGELQAYVGEILAELEACE